MPKKATLPNYWESKKCYGTNYGGKATVLVYGKKDEPDGPVYTEAKRLFAALIGMDQNRKTDDYLVSAVVNSYRLETIKDEADLYYFDLFMKPFVEHFDGLTVGHLAPVDVDQWIDGHDGWGAGMKRQWGRKLLTLFNWAKRKKLIVNNPLRDAQGDNLLQTRSVRLRGREAVLPAALMDGIQTSLLTSRQRSPGLAVVLDLLRHTGARPGEILKCEAHNVRGPMIVYRADAAEGYVWKNARKTGKDRTIHLQPRLARIVAEHVRQRPSGPIFRTDRGKVWTRDLVNSTMYRLRKRPAIVELCRTLNYDPAEIKMYNYRHTWLTNYVHDTGDVWGAAKLCGTSVLMIEKHYCHDDVDKLHERYLRYMGTGYNS